jgi:hypothetical protein
MCDVDFPCREEIIVFLPPHLTDFDIAIASREASGQNVKMNLTPPFVCRFSKG